MEFEVYNFENIKNNLNYEKFSSNTLIETGFLKVSPESFSNLERYNYHSNPFKK